MKIIGENVLYDDPVSARRFRPLTFHVDKRFSRLVVCGCPFSLLCIGRNDDNDATPMNANVAMSGFMFALRNVARK